MGKKIFLCLLFFCCICLQGCDGSGAQAPLPPTQRITLSGSAVSREEAPFSLRLDYTLCQTEGGSPTVQAALFVCAAQGQTFPSATGILTVGTRILPFEIKGEKETDPFLCYSHQGVLQENELTEGLPLCVFVKLAEGSFLTAQTVLRLPK